jgi:hypothetical protein
MHFAVAVVHDARAARAMTAGRIEPINFCAAYAMPYCFLSP